MQAAAKTTRISSDLERRVRASLGAAQFDRLVDSESTEPLVERLLTQLMEHYRVTRSEGDFCLIFDLGAPLLLRRIRMRLRRYGCDLDEADVLQETLLNVYRYPDRFSCERDGAFKAWTGAILENAVRRLMKKRLRRRARFEDASELLEDAPADGRSDPVRLAADQEQRLELTKTYLVLLAA